jgi:hypothetical protein
MFSLNMLFWNNGDPVRLENTRFCWDKAKELINFLNFNNVPSKANLFDFSSENCFNDAIHIPLNEKYYQRSKKINFALNHEINNNSSVFSIIDSDCFFFKNYYEELKDDVISSYEKNLVYTYQLIDIPLERRYEFIDFENNVEKFNSIEENIKKNNFAYRHSAGFGTMGGFFICGTKQLKDAGGFNESFLTWGAEDDEAVSRLRNIQAWMPKRENKGPIHLGHNKDLKDNYYYIPVYSDEYYQVNKVRYGRRYES